MEVRGSGAAHARRSRESDAAIDRAVPPGVVRGRPTPDRARYHLGRGRRARERGRFDIAGREAQLPARTRMIRGRTRCSARRLRAGGPRPAGARRRSNGPVRSAPRTATSSACCSRCSMPWATRVHGRIAWRAPGGRGAGRSLARSDGPTPRGRWAAPSQTRVGASMADRVAQPWVSDRPPSGADRASDPGQPAPPDRDDRHHPSARSPDCPEPV